MVLAGFCWITALYAFVTSSAFAYLQFVKPRVFPWVGRVSDWNPVASGVALVLLAILVWPDVNARSGLVRTLSRLGLAVIGAAVSWNLVSPVLWGLTDGTRTLLIGAAVLLPLVWLAILDVLHAAPYLHAQRSRANELEQPLIEARLLTAVILTAFLLSALYAVLASFGIANRFEPDLLIGGQLSAFAVSLIYHLAIGVFLFLLLALVVRATNIFAMQYVLVSLILVVIVALAFAQIVGDALSLHGFPAAIAALATATSIVGTWTGLRIRALEARQTPLESALDLYFGPKRVGSAAVKFACVGLLAFGVIRISSLADWDFALLDSGVLLVWFTTLALAHQSVPPVTIRSYWIVALACIVPLAASVPVAAWVSMRTMLDRYAVYNPSFRVAESVLGNNGQGISSFDKYLRANTGLTDVKVAPIDLDFVSNPGAPPGPPPSPGPLPSIFLFVIDSLRPDYLAPYNSEVRFTPRVAEFAAESVVFTNAITRYGGTGLSVPAIWAGSAIIHKQYVMPFHPMNTLEKLLDANPYKRLIGLDSIMSQLLRSAPDLEELDRGRPVMDYEFCRTLGELESKLPSKPGPPVFAYTLPQDIHMSKLPRSVESGEEYRSFHAPYATKVHAIDACFGRFIDALKSKRLYDDSLIVLTADHGEMLGEDGRFGHSYHLFPQVVRVPLIIHLPSWLARNASIDPDAVSLTTDISPTMYSALGYKPAGSNYLAGRSLIATDEMSSLARRRESYVIAASYGAVYAVASHNARRLYVADAVRGGDRAFEQDRSGRWTEAKVTPGLRAVNQFAIRRYIDDLTALYIERTDIPQFVNSQ
jgi:Sulfatase